MQISLHAQTYKLTYEPKGKIVEFYLDKVKFITDYKSLYDVFYNNNKQSIDTLYKIMIDTLNSKFKSGNDTIYFKTTDILFKFKYESTCKKGDDFWNILDFYELFLKLLYNDKMMIIDKHNNKVNDMYIKNIKSKAMLCTYPAYCNKATKEVLYRGVCNR